MRYVIVTRIYAYTTDAAHALPQLQMLCDIPTVQNTYRLTSSSARFLAAGPLSLATALLQGALETIGTYISDLTIQPKLNMNHKR